MNNTKEKKHILNNIANNIHTGNLLTTFFKKRRIYKSALARHLQRRVDTIRRYQKNPSIQVAILWEISTVLKHNFFMDIAATMPSDYTTDAPPNNDSAERVLALQKQVDLLTAERDILLDALKNKMAG